jgi:hypothetical protein
MLIQTQYFPKREFQVWLEDAITKIPLDEYQVDHKGGHVSGYVKSTADQHFRIRFKLTEDALPQEYGVDIYMDGKLIICPVLGEIAGTVYRNVSICNIDCPGDYIVPLRFGDTKTHEEHGTKNLQLLNDLGRITVAIYPVEIRGPCKSWPKDFTNLVYNTQLVHPLKNHSAKLFHHEPG